jgi:hypothetical protein
MRLPLVALSWMIGLAGAASAQSGKGTWLPCTIANHANGFDYQPTQRQVYPREVAAGVAPSTAREADESRTLEQLDRSLLLSEGVNPDSAPVFVSRR